MSTRNRFLLWWVGGLVAFAIVIWMHLPLAVEGVPGGMAEHQAAGDAATVNRIHAAWQAAGVFEQAKFAMIGDLIFIGIYGIGSVLGGLYFRQVGSGFVRHLGTIIALAGAIFLLADYGETIAQFIQLTGNAGDDGLAGFAAAVRPTKMAAWIITFFGVLIAFAVRRMQRSAS